MTLGCTRYGGVVIPENDEKPEKDLDILANMGIQIEGRDVEYGLLSIIEIATFPRSVYRRLKILPDLLDRAIPDTEYTRRRIARFLLGVEMILYATRKMLAAESIDILREFKTILREAVESNIPESGSPTAEDLKNFKQYLSERMNELGERVTEGGDPDILEAFEVFKTITPVFDFDQEDFDLKGVKEFDVKSLVESEKRVNGEDD